MVPFSVRRRSRGRLELLEIVPMGHFIGRVKGAASYRVNKEVQPGFKLKWQEGYGVLTLREEELEKVSRYIDNQESHRGSGRLSELLERTESDEQQPHPQTPPPEGGSAENERGLSSPGPRRKRLG